MGTSEGPAPTPNDVVALAAQALQQKAKQEQDEIQNLITLRSADRDLTSQKVRGARIAAGDMTAVKEEELTVDGTEPTAKPTVIDNLIDVKLTQWKSVAVHGTATGVVGLANILWLTNFGTELPDEVSQVVIAAVAQVAAGQGIPVWLANFVMRWKS